jgi:hypothetical protein
MVPERTNPYTQGMTTMAIATSTGRICLDFGLSKNAFVKQNVDCRDHATQSQCSENVERLNKAEEAVLRVGKKQPWKSRERDTADEFEQRPHRGQEENIPPGRQARCPIDGNSKGSKINRAVQRQRNPAERRYRNQPGEPGRKNAKPARIPPMAADR